MFKKKTVSLEERLVKFLQGGGMIYLLGCTNVPLLLEVAQAAGFNEVESPEFIAWLNDLFTWVGELIGNGQPFDSVVRRVNVVIEGSRPLEDIDLGRLGILIIPTTTWLGNTKIKLFPRDEFNIPVTGPIGVHGECGGAFHIQTIDPQHDRLVCTGCNVASEPISPVYTFADLRDAGRRMT